MGWHPCCCPGGSNVDCNDCVGTYCGGPLTLTISGSTGCSLDGVYTLLPTPDPCPPGLWRASIFTADGQCDFDFSCGADTFFTMIVHPVGQATTYPQTSDSSTCGPLYALFNYSIPSLAAGCCIGTAYSFTAEVSP